jgi:hypothetical protein
MLDRNAAPLATLTSACLIFCGATAMAGSPAEASRTALEVLTRSGARQQIDAISSGALIWLGAEARNVPTPARRGIEEAISRGFKAEEILHSAALQLSAPSDRDALAEVAAWLRSSAGMSIARAELTADAFRRAECQLPHRDDDSERADLIQRVDGLCGLSERAGDRVRSTLGGLLRGAADELAERGGPSRGALTNAARDELMVRLSPVSLSSRELACAYRDVATDDLAAYIDFLRSDAGIWYRRRLLDAIESAIALHAEEAGRRLVANLVDDQSLDADESSPDRVTQAQRR